MTIGLYTRTGCPHCEELSGLLNSLAVPVDNPENISELRNNGMYLSGAPVLRVGDTWPGPAELFSGGYLAAGQVTGIIMGAGHV